MKFSLLLAGFLALAGAASAQNYPVEAAEMQLNNIPRTGLQTTIELDKKFVEKHWEKTLREQKGKVSISKGTYTVENAKMPSVSANPVKIISRVESGKAGTVVWYTIDLGSAYVTADGDKNAYAAAEQFLKDFGTLAYTEDVNLQISDAERVLNRTQGEYDRTIKGGADLEARISKNKANRALLEKQLAENADELTKLEQDVETNKKAQETARQEVENMRKALELVKAKSSVVILDKK